MSWVDNARIYRIEEGTQYLFFLPCAEGTDAFLEPMYAAILLKFEP